MFNSDYSKWCDLLTHGHTDTAFYSYLRIMLCTTYLGRLYHGLGVPEEAFLIFHSEVSMDPNLRHVVYLANVML